MFKVRKGDLWKAIVLVLAISGTGWFIVRALVAASRPPAVAQGTSRAAPSSDARTSTSPGSEDKKERMFARRPRTPMADLERARAAPDPFRPYVSVRAASESSSQARSQDDKPNPLASELEGVRLTGIVSDTRQPLAALRDGDDHYYLRVGEALPGGWRLVEVGRSSVTLAKSNQRVELALAGSRRKAGR
jgi:hypothetical protein